VERYIYEQVETATVLRIRSLTCVVYDMSAAMHWICMNIQGGPKKWHPDLFCSITLAKVHKF